MLKLRHHLATACRSETDSDRAFLLRSGAGDMLSFYTSTQSRYEGWYIWRHEGFIKILERISLVGRENESPTTLINHGHSSTWEYEDGLKLTWLPLKDQSGLTLFLSEPARLRILLDIRGMYSYPKFNRDYSVTPDEGGHMVRYFDPMLKAAVYFHIRTGPALTLVEDWVPRTYPRDEARHSLPTELHTYAFAEVTAGVVAMGAGLSAEEASAASLAASKMRPTKAVPGINYTHDTLLNEVNVAKVSVQESLRWLQTEDGIWAGLPWFHQVWARDELITALGLDRGDQEDVIRRYLGYPLEKGELPTFLGSGTTCADGVGWLCLLVREYGIDHLQPQDRARLLRFLRVAHVQLSSARQNAQWLIHSSHNATWMDTIGREGYRIEIQAMYGLMLELLFELTEEDRYEQERLRLRGTIKQYFYKNGYLHDGLGDPTIRPNVFLAYLLQPDFLSSALWQSCFDTALHSLRTSWGGLTSVATADPNFHEASSGEDNISYHNGDSWFFVNNLAAIALIRFNQHRYGKAIVDILQGSTTEILWHNMIGQPGEISSARALESFGCGIQAFSGGSYLALLREFEDYSASHDRESISFFWDSTTDSSSATFLR